MRLLAFLLISYAAVTSAYPPPERIQVQLPSKFKCVTINELDGNTRVLCELKESP